MFILSPDSALMFFDTHIKLTASLAYIGAGALSAKDAIHDIPPSLRGKGVLRVHQCFSERFRWIVSDVEIEGS